MRPRTASTYCSPPSLQAVNPAGGLLIGPSCNGFLALFSYGSSNAPSSPASYNQITTSTSMPASAALNGGLPAPSPGATALAYFDVVGLSGAPTITYGTPSVDKSLIESSSIAKGDTYEIIGYDYVSGGPNAGFNVIYQSSPYTARYANVLFVTSPLTGLTLSQLTHVYFVFLSVPSPPTPSPSPTTPPGYRIVHNFQNSFSLQNPAGDGFAPSGSLVAVGDTLYGVTEVGGGTLGGGTLFAATPSGTVTVLDLFPYPAFPVSPPTYLNGTFYGTFPCGCASGALYTAASSVAGYPPAVSIAHGFGAGTDGRVPEASLTLVNGTFYGTTAWGGGTNASCSPGCGTIFSFTPSTGAYTVLHAFQGQPDGSIPVARLLNVNGTLYGTTSTGGTANGGTVFSITTGGTYNLLYSFQGSPDGSYPQAGLTNVVGTLYGTTTFGGSSCSGCGTVYSITPSGTEKVIYSFQNAPDGLQPWSDLLNVGGVLYGTTFAGGNVNGNGCAVSSSCGTVFKVTRTGMETVLHRFTNSPDGVNPQSGLTQLGGMLYGVTNGGGSGNNPPNCAGCGVIYAIAP
jgi:uncharacterized repeat protein (TIGR03803 family)